MITSWKNINKTIPNKSVEKQKQNDILYSSHNKDIYYLQSEDMTNNFWREIKVKQSWTCWRKITANLKFCDQGKDPSEKAIFR